MCRRKPKPAKPCGRQKGLGGLPTKGGTLGIRKAGGWLVLSLAKAGSAFNAAFERSNTASIGDDSARFGNRDVFGAQVDLDP